MSTVTDQLPPNTQVSGGASSEAVGVIDERLQTSQDVLQLQAVNAAKQRLLASQDRSVAMQVYEDGADFSPEFMSMVKGNAYRGIKDVNQDTLNSLMQGSQIRDQQYIGNNADWTGYYLEPLAKFIMPVDTPVRNLLPRTPGVGIDKAYWRAITDVFNGNGPSVSDFILSQGSSPVTQQYNWVDKNNLFRMLGRQDIVTFESEIYGRLFEPDVRAKVAAKLAPTLMLGQEQWYLNAAQNLWTPPYPLASAVNNGSGALTNGTTYWFIVTSVNSVGETLGSTAQSVLVSSPNNAVQLTLFRVPNATSYNVYVGTGSTQPANSAMWKQSATSQFGGATALNDPANGVQTGYFTATMTAAPATSGTAYSTIVTAGNTAIAYSSGGGGTPANVPLTFDGIQSLVYGNTGTLSTMGVGGETAVVKHVADSGGALAASDINNLLRSMNLNSRANPEYLLTSIVDHQAVSDIVTKSTNFRINTPNGASLADLVGGYRATKWVNQTTGRVMDIIMCPYLMQGTIVALSLQLPFMVTEITKPPLRVEYNREMWAVDYPPDQSHKTQWAFAAYSNETLVAQNLGHLGILNGVVAS